MNRWKKAAKARWAKLSKSERVKIAKRNADISVQNRAKFKNDWLTIKDIIHSENSDRLKVEFIRNIFTN